MNINALDSFMEIFGFHRVDKKEDKFDEYLAKKEKIENAMWDYPSIDRRNKEKYDIERII